MTPSEYIEAMGAGWNLGSCYDGSFYDKINNKYRYWCCNGAWKYKVGSGNYSDITVFNEAYSTSNKLKQFSFSFTPTSDNVSITLKHQVLSETTETLPLVIQAATVAGSTVSTLATSLIFPTFSSNESTLNLDLTTIFSESVANKAVVLKVKIDSANLAVYPTNDESTLSAIRSYIITRVINKAGFQDVREVVIKAVAAAGFKSIRIPVQWMGHLDELDNEGHIHVDTEFLDHLATVLGWCHDNGLLVCVNMHHDDNTRDIAGWLTTTQYLADPTVSVRYKDIWRQVATYFKDYGDWLSFASNNETLNDAQHWEYPSKSDVYALVQMQKDFYDTVRSISGNEHRICIYPTYAAKTSCLNSAWENPSDSTDKGTWTIPYGDEYGIVEIHPYAASDISVVRSTNKSARNKHLPIIFGEFGNGNWNDINTCQVTAYQVGYATFYKMGTFLWDDDGNMRILNRRNVTTSNYRSKSLWAGNIHEFIPNLVKCANLQEAEILLNNRRQTCYAGDTVSIHLDTPEYTIVSNEGSADTSIKNGNEVTVGFEDVSDLLAISYDGQYNVIDIIVDKPDHWTETVYDDLTKWKHREYSIFKQDGYRYYDNSNSHFSIEIPISSKNGVIEITVRNTTTVNPMQVLEYDDTKTLIRNWNEMPEIYYNSDPLALHPACAFFVVQFKKNNSSTQLKEGTWVKVRQRDMSAVEEKNRTDDFTASIVNYNNYSVSVYRTIEAAGGVDYVLNLGSDRIKAYIQEFNGDKLESEGWYENGDTIHTNLFTKTMRIELVVPNNKIADVIDLFNSKTIFPVLEYTDFYDRPSQYNEVYTPVQNQYETVAGKFIGVGNKLLTVNGKSIQL